MPGDSTRTLILNERHVGGRLSAELPRPGDKALPGVDPVALNFMQALAHELDSGTLRLPSPPEVVIKIRHALSEEHGNPGHVARVIGGEPVIAARIIRAANAAYFAHSSRPVSDLRTAVVRLGLEIVYSLTMSTALEQVLHSQLPDALRPRLKSEWERSVLVAAIAQRLAHFGSVSPDEAFLAGLLHGVGRLYVLRRAKEYPELLRGDALSQVMTAWQHTLGFALLTNWGLAIDIAYAVKDYDSYDASVAGPVTLTTIVHLADRLADEIEANQPEPPAWFPRCEAVELTDDTWRSVVEGVTQDLAQLYRVLGV